MSPQTRNEAREVELMGSGVIDDFLSREPLCSPDNTPQDEGTRLRRFIHDQAEICNLRLYRSGRHGVVLLASIQNTEYALKVFKRWKQPGPVYYPYKQALLITPFACESRAFARLSAMDSNGTWATRCHGWMELSQTQLEAISLITETDDLSRWVIVKDYEPEPTTASHVPDIYTNFAIAERARILPQDIRIENYRGARIVDLSSTLTHPCPEWSEFAFRFFYTDTVDGVYDWFSDSPSPSPLPPLPPTPSPLLQTMTLSFLLPASAFALLLCGSLIWRRIRYG